jgi:hypothetical protein
MDYAGAAYNTKMAYEQVLEAAAMIGVQIEPQFWQAIIPCCFLITPTQAAPASVTRAVQTSSVIPMWLLV